MSDVALGLDGADVIADTAVHTPPDDARQVWFAIQVVADAVLDVTGTLVNWNGLASLAGVSFAAGTILRGRFTAIQLVSGSVLAHQKDL